MKTFDLSECELYTNCKPCPICLAAILWARIPTVYYGGTRHDAERIGFRDGLFHKELRIKTGGGAKMRRIGRLECLKVFQEWTAKMGKVPY